MYLSIGSSGNCFTCTADAWHFERCLSGQANGLVYEPSAVCEERYAAFLRQACSVEV